MTDCAECTEILWCDECCEFHWCDVCEWGPVVMGPEGNLTGMRCESCWELICNDCQPGGGKLCLRCGWLDGPDSEARRAARTPAPTHTPAVRRVVAWVATRSPSNPYLDADTAYADAAMQRMAVNGADAPSRRRLHRRVHERNESDGSGWTYLAEVRDRLASLLRHWDEKAGHR